MKNAQSYQPFENVPGCKFQGQQNSNFKVAAVVDDAAVEVLVAAAVKAVIVLATDAAAVDAVASFEVVTVVEVVAVVVSSDISVDVAVVVVVEIEAVVVEAVIEMLNFKYYEGCA